MLNINLLLKEEILDRFNFHCSHRHSGITHPVCYDKARGKGERIGFFDIESGGSLDADWGFGLCYRIKALDGDVIGSSVTPAEIRKPLMTGEGTKDKGLLERFCKDVWNFDTLVVYYGKDTGGRYQRHDIPFMRTRAAKWGVEGFPKWKQIKVIDVFDIVKKYFKLSRRSMKSAATLYGIDCKMNYPFVMDVWQDAICGHKAALDYIENHCEEDVYTLEKLYKKVICYKETRTKI